MQHKPRFSGIIIAAVLMVAALVMISSYSSLFASSKSTMMLSEAMGYFESNQVTYFNPVSKTQNRATEQGDRCVAGLSV